MRVWRIATDTLNYVADDLSGAGAKSTGGRWNSHGRAMLYCSETPSLACLETLVHLEATGLPFNRYLVAIDIPQQVWDARAISVPERLSVGWDATPAGLVSVAYGDTWLTSMISAVLMLPSVIVPED